MLLIRIRIGYCFNKDWVMVHIALIRMWYCFHKDLVML